MLWISTIHHLVLRELIVYLIKHIFCCLRICQSLLRNKYWRELLLRSLFLIKFARWLYLLLLRRLIDHIVVLVVHCKAALVLILRTSDLWRDHRWLVVQFSRLHHHWRTHIRRKTLVSHLLCLHHLRWRIHRIVLLILLRDIIVHYLVLAHDEIAHIGICWHSMGLGSNRMLVVNRTLGNISIIWRSNHHIVVLWHLSFFVETRWRNHIVFRLHISPRITEETSTFRLVRRLSVFTLTV